MNEQNYINPTDIYDRTEKAPNIPDVNPEPFTDPVPVNADLIHEVPMEETDAPNDLVNEPLPGEIPMGETPVEAVPVAETMVPEPPEDGPITQDTPVGANVGPVALLKHEDSEHFRTRWNEIQGMFVDEPRVAVQQADALVSEVMEQITQMFASEHGLLEGQWKQGNDVSTEDLRKVLQRYRSFFNRLVV
ncbi:hypothetical protein LARV_01353 [Longilinea arvoryzae]|uniref:Uncharacterized protein n=1 Tax=Longilinea arvoryzae TaxID=360412 RepID=A0A0S7B8N4_9CHLR|nr:hypothetical protein [Longilinea arvoryzae]GAP13598.1 hypothetical protein LARV_01353 [Longilinea arvoryzae]